jgi:hypothetical protein
MTEPSTREAFEDWVYKYADSTADRDQLWAAWQESRKQALEQALEAVEYAKIINPWNSAGLILNRHLKNVHSDIKALLKP